ncbi:MAG: hypothetical protein V7L28_10055 [Nostoc sp.]
MGSVQGLGSNETVNASVVKFAREDDSLDSVDHKLFPKGRSLTI